MRDFSRDCLHEKIGRPGKDRSYIGDFLSSPIPFGRDYRNSKWRQARQAVSRLTLWSATGEDDFSSLAGIEAPTGGFSGPTFFHKNNGLAPEWLFLQPRRINRLDRFSRTNPSEIRAYFHDVRKQREARGQAHRLRSSCLSVCVT
jgi:hypothetical protein